MRRTLPKVDRWGSPLSVEPPLDQAADETPRARWPRIAERLRRPTRSPRPRRWFLAGVAAVAVLGLVVFALTRGPDTAPLTASDVDKAVQDGIAKAQEDAAKAPPDAAAAYRVALPSLVTISSRRTNAK